MEKYQVNVDGNIIEYQVTRRSKKNMSIRVDPHSKVTVSITKRTPLYKAEEFVIKKADWIIKQQNNFAKHDFKKEELDYYDGEQTYLLGRKFDFDIAPGKKNIVELQGNYIHMNIKENFWEDKDYTKKVYDKWLKEYSYNVFSKITNEYQKIMEPYGVPYPEIKVKNMKSRWGVCYPTKRLIVYNLNLIKAPIECVQYVVVHELSHFKHANHSRAFHEFVENFMPDYKVRKKILDKEYTGVV